VLLLSLLLICVLLIRFAEQRLCLLVLIEEALLLSLKLGNAKLRVKRSSYSVQANVRLKDKSI
jgi:hypothetical protein